MVFSSLPLYLDPPNWQQQQPQGSGNYEDQQLQLPPQPRTPPVPRQLGSNHGTSTSVRPASMTERTRLAKIPQPDGPLKCPRCESTNTKFCYFNNYSLSQPRHFCKTCRRYWTRDGALRNVPVGGGCRRNNSKRSRNPGKKSPATTTATNTNHQRRHQRAPESSTVPDPLGAHHFLQLAGASQLSYLATLQNLARFGMGNLGLNLEGLNMQPQAPDHFSGANEAGPMPPQEFPFLGDALEAMPPTSAAGLGNLYPFQNSGAFQEAGATATYGNEMMMGSRKPSGSGDQVIISQMGPMKMEDSTVGNINKQLMGMAPLGNSDAQQFSWVDDSAGINSGNVWNADLLGITSSSAVAAGADARML